MFPARQHFFNYLPAFVPVQVYVVVVAVSDLEVAESEFDVVLAEKTVSLGCLFRILYFFDYLARLYDLRLPVWVEEVPGVAEGY